MREAGATVDELRAAGFTLSELRTAGTPLYDLVLAGYTPKQLDAASFAFEELSRHFRIADLIDGGIQPRGDVGFKGSHAEDLWRAGRQIRSNPTRPAARVNPTEPDRIRSNLTSPAARGWAARACHEGLPRLRHESATAPP